MQKISIIGNVGQDAVLRTPTNGGEQFISFTVGCNESYTNAEGVKVEKTQWYDCVYRRIKLAPFIKKGDQIHLEGRPGFSMYDTKEGKKAISVTVNVQDITLLNNKRD